MNAAKSIVGMTVVQIFKRDLAELYKQLEAEEHPISREEIWKDIEILELDLVALGVEV